MIGANLNLDVLELIAKRGNPITPSDALELLARIRELESRADTRAMEASAKALTDEKIEAIRHAVCVLDHYSKAADSPNAKSSATLSAMLAPQPSASPAALTALPFAVLDALRFYARGSHFTLSDRTAWDTVSGEPQNFWCDEAGTATVEDGSIAKAVLRGQAFDIEEPEPPIEGEVFTLAASPATANGALTDAVDVTIKTIERQLELIAERAPGNNLEKRPVVQSLQAHIKRLRAALSASQAGKGESQ